jgi:hypothetical protein
MVVLLIIITPLEFIDLDLHILLEIFDEYLHLADLVDLILILLLQFLDFLLPIVDVFLVLVLLPIELLSRPSQLRHAPSLLLLYFSFQVDNSVPLLLQLLG